jgi:hypothetical protein
MSEILATPDAFATLNALIKLAADPAAHKARVDQLKRAIDKAAAAESKLAARSAAHDQKVAKDHAELEERERKVRKREVDLHAREARLAADQQLIEKAKADLRSKHHDPNLFGGLTREPDPDEHRRPVDAHYDG